MSLRPSREELRLWNAVARTVTPTHGASDNRPGKSLEDLRGEMAALMAAGTNPSPAGQQKPVHPPQKPARNPKRPDRAAQAPPKNGLKTRFRQNALDERAFRDIRKGRLAIDARLDLHGLTQAEAHVALDNFIVSARASGRRHVLVITGKGRGNDGVLKRNVPVWLSMPPLSLHVNGMREAHGEHGGGGALYVRLRRPA